MGKRNKTSEDTPTKKAKTVHINANDASPSSSTIKKTKNKQRKNKKQTHTINPEKISNEDLKLDELVPQLEKVQKKKKSRKEDNNKTNSLPVSQTKKIVFVDDEPYEVSANTDKVNDAAAKKNKFLNEDEAEVKDEDIDKFCDELNEEDNKQYEDWVKLIEAKLHENKKSK